LGCWIHFENCCWNLGYPDLKTVILWLPGSLWRHNNCPFLNSMHMVSRSFLNGNHMVLPSFSHDFDCETDSVGHQNICATHYPLTSHNFRDAACNERRGTIPQLTEVEKVICNRRFLRKTRLLYCEQEFFFSVSDFACCNHGYTTCTAFSLSLRTMQLCFYLCFDGAPSSAWGP
jgi:hypothetical protein